jgi:hypothetical protein
MAHAGDPGSTSIMTIMVSSVSTPSIDPPSIA